MIRSLVRRLVGKKPPAQFSRQELNGLFSAIKDAAIETVGVERFTRRMIRRRAGGGRKQGWGLLRFDIHGNIERPLQVAQDLNALGMHGLFLTMHRHTVNDGIFDARSTWTTLKTIAGLGHEIGLHFDPFYLIRAHGDLYIGLRAALGELASRGIEVRAASVHGDTRPHIKEVGLQANDFFSEGFRQSHWTGRPPTGEEFLAKHVKRYSQKKIGEDLGILFFAEPNFAHMGELVGDDNLTYMSDNRRRIHISNITVGERNDGLLIAPEPLRISSEFAREAAEALKGQPFLSLLHPQWYA